MNSIVVISGIMRLDARARQDIAILGSKFLKLDGKFCYTVFRVTNRSTAALSLRYCTIERNYFIIFPNNENSS